MQLKYFCIAWLYFWLAFLFFPKDGISQELLTKELSYYNTEQRSIREILSKISEDHDFYFSFQGNTLAVDQSSEMQAYEGTLRGFLIHLLGNQYEFKEIPDYIIIRYAPKTLDLDADIDKSSKQVIVKGYVKDLDTRENISFASVYERNALVSTLSDQKGYFEIRLRPSQQSLWLSLSKENYRDTTFILLPTVDIRPGNFQNRLTFFPDAGDPEAMEESFLGSLFIGFRQRLQRLNLGSLFGQSPYQVSLLPGIGSQGMFSSQMINRFSLNLLGGYSAGNSGFEVAGIFNLNQSDSKGFQSAGMFNVVGGKVSGFQVAGIHNLVFQELNGIQVAGLYNYVKKGANGLQVAGLINRTDSSANHQLAGLINYAGKSQGLQVAGLVNSSHNQAGMLQMAGLINHTNGTVHHQVAGLMNTANSAKGIQFGLINRAETSAYPIGLLNLVKVGGHKTIGAAIDETAVTSITLRTGGENLYGLLGLGFEVPSRFQGFVFDIGFGAYLLEKGPFTLDLEGVHRLATDFNDHTHHYQSLRLLPGYRFSDRVIGFVGPSLNSAILDPGHETQVPGAVIWQYTNKNGTYGIFGGLIGGIQYVL
jgi:hypothetical protein